MQLVLLKNVYEIRTLEAEMKHIRENIGFHDSQNKRQQILEAAYAVFSSKGYHRATVDEIIALADTGKGTVYNYFVNKEQLFYTLIKECSMPFQVIIEGIVNSSEPPLEKVETIIKAFLEFYAKHANLWRVMMHEVRGFGAAGSSNFTQEQLDKYQACFCETIGMIEKVLLEAQSKGFIRESCDATRAAHGLFSVIVTFVFRDFVDENIGETAHTIAELFLYGAAER
nr:TetR/AcrR family transcriptional regulator [Pelosinus fermentans]